MSIALGQGAFMWGIGTICQLHRLPFDPELLLKRVTPPYDNAVLQRTLKELGFKTHSSSKPLAELHPASFPILVILKPADQVANSPLETPISDSPASELIEASYSLGLVLKMDQERVLLLLPESSVPVTVSIVEFNQRFTGEVILVTPEKKPLTDDNHQPAKFGFKWFIPELLKHKKIWREILLASFAIQVVALATPLCTQVIIDKVVVHHTVSTLIVIAVALGIFLVFNAAMGWVRQYLVLHTGNRIDAVLGHKVFGHLLHLPMRYFDHRPTGTLVARLHGIETIRDFLAGSLITLLLDFPFLFVFLAIMFWYSWQLTLIALAVLTLITILSLAITPLLRKKLNQQFLLGARNQAFLTEYVSGMETVKSLQLEPQLEKQYGDYLAAYLASTFDSKQLSNTYNTAANTLDQVQTLSILCAGAWIVMHNPEFTIGMLVAFQMFSGRLSGPVLRMVGMWQEFQQADIAVKRLGDLMDAPTEPYSLIPKRLGSQSGLIQFNDLGFRYSEHHPWLYRNLNLIIKPNKCTVIMGPSGCGKSTLAKLMLGFQQPQEGNITLDGKDIRHLSANELRHHFGVVPQETTLFSGTLYENFTLANPHASFEQIIQACQLAGIHDTIEKLPEAYNTQIGEHGTGLSGGQKQRIAIARALLRQPRILVFDEAVSNLDPHTAEQFAQTINRLKGKVTIIFITHQLPKALQVDEAILLGKENAETLQDNAMTESQR
ncbi:peptidase domain-containing ABC transporter [Methylobacillus gramineus]|uniref:peptidase domain-containing ABC transporter n=1 Tax=Methylobacillus gramineus TaxID=755169 RepID=UPI001CFFD294|nr:peptidase domain-containing ABC transporter [Methylobacillus gramineus]MCB5184522.1 peptidase domain-containing ABC transporter [Methylobacillus gramineus]